MGIWLGPRGRAAYAAEGKGFGETRPAATGAGDRFRSPGYGIRDLTKQGIPRHILGTLENWWKMLSSKAKYGLKAMVHLTRRAGEGSVLIAEIAEAENIPKKFLDAILLELKNRGFLSSKKGKGGGYVLAKSPDRIMVGDIVRVLDGPLAPVPCVSRTAYRRCDDCNDENTCAIRAVMGEVRDAIAGILDNTTLSAMALEKRPEPVLMYDI